MVNIDCWPCVSLMICIHVGLSTPKSLFSWFATLSSQWHCHYNKSTEKLNQFTTKSFTFSVYLHTCFGWHHFTQRNNNKKQQQQQQQNTAQQKTTTSNKILKNTLFIDLINLQVNTFYIIHCKHILWVVKVGSI